MHLENNIHSICSWFWFFLYHCHITFQNIDSQINQYFGFTGNKKFEIYIQLEALKNMILIWIVFHNNYIEHMNWFYKITYLMQLCIKRYIPIFFNKRCIQSKFGSILISRLVSHPAPFSFWKGRFRIFGYLNRN